MYCYNLGDILFVFNTERSIIESKYYGIFRTDEKSQIADKQIFIISDIPAQPGEYGRPVFSSSDSSVYKTDKGYALVTNRYNRRRYKAVCIQQENGGEIFFTDSGDDLLQTSAELFRLIDLVSAFVNYNAFIMHGAVVEHNGKCIVFSGDSGVGKSTQAELWNEYRGSRIINGDRVLIRKTDKGFYAYGLPMCGSSDYCENYRMPVEAVVFPVKAYENSVSEPEKKIEKFMLLTSQITCGVRKEGESEKLMHLTEDFLESIPVIKLDCTISEDAVSCLENYLLRK